MMAVDVSTPMVSRRSMVQAAALAGIGIAGQALGQSTAGVTNTEVRLGQTAALTGPLSFANVQANLAANAFFNDVNQRGGVAGRKITLVSLDDQYDSAKALANFKQLQTEGGGILSLFGVGGAPSNMAVQPLAEEAGLISFAPFSGFDGLRNPKFKNMYHIRATYGQELAKIAAYCATSGLKNVTVLYSDNAFGKGALAGFEAVAAKLGVIVKGKVMMADKVDDVTSITKAIAATSPQAVLGVNSAAAGFSWAKSELGKLGVPYMTISLLGNEQTVKVLGPASKGLIVAQTVPYPRSRKYPLSNEMTAVATKAGFAEPGFSAMEGYIAARVMVEALTRAGKNLSTKTLEAALGSAKFDLKGYVVDFTGGSRSGSSFVELSQVNLDGRFVQ
jgi:branched-chain amino acid transport system substrate-binding protein